MNKNFFIGRVVSLAVLAWSLFSALNIPVFAAGGTATKTFDFGAGGDNPTFRSHSRSFLVPQAVAIAVRVSFRTTGESAIPITVELENGDSRVVEAQDVSAEKSAQQIIINVSATENTVFGCEKGWQVRVKSRDGKIPAARVYGEINLSFIDSPAASIRLEQQLFDLKKGMQIVSRIGTTETFRHTGIVNIRASWTHNPLTSALPLKFELVRPDGSTAHSLVGYGTNSAAQPKMDFDYRIIVADTRQTGAWRLRITNSTDQEIFEIKPGVNFTRRCFE